MLIKEYFDAFLVSNHWLDIDEGNLIAIPTWWVEPDILNMSSDETIKQ